MKKIIIIFIIILMTFSVVSADTSMKVFLNNKEITFTVAPTLINNRTMVQVRPLFEALGLQVNYDNKTKTITGIKEKKRITLQLDNNKANINGSEYILDVPAKSINGSTMVPLRFIAESIKAKIEVKENSIFITTPNTTLYNTKNLRYDADFKLSIESGINWVPANKLGMPQLTENDIKNLDITTDLKEKVNTIYDVMHLIQTMNLKIDDGNQQVEYQNVYWEIPRPVENSLKTKFSNCYGLSELAVYLLNDNYEEIGFLHFGKMDNGHIINYIKHNNKYYVFDLTGYFNDNVSAGIETGDFSDYYKKDSLDNIHEVNSLEEYVQFYMKKSNNKPGFITTFKNKFPIASFKKGNIRTYSYPTNIEYKVLYDNQDDNIKLITLPAPSMEGVYK